MKRGKPSERGVFSNEEKLRAANQQLSAVEQQLHAVNQQLQADEQQLCVVNEQLEVSERRYRRLFSEMSSGFALHEVICDDSGEPCDYRFLDLNPAFEDITGLVARDIVGKTVLEVLPDTEFHWIETYGKVALTGESVHFENYSHEFDRYYDVVAYCPEKGKFATIFKDVTKRKRVEEEREKLLKAVALKNEELQSIVYISSHDLKTPLVNIRGFSEILVEHCEDIRGLVKKADIDGDVAKKILSVLDEDISCDLEYITTSAERMRKLIDGLLKVSRIGTIALEVKTINMNEVISEILSTVKYRADEVGAEITFSDLVECKGDKHQLTQLFTNLIDNALKYRSGERKCSIRVTCKKENGQSIYCVEDNGIGIPKTYHHKIFGIYNRLHPNGPAEGEGLGLTIVQRILDRHNGLIWIESDYGKGSKFFVSLPIGD